MSKLKKTLIVVSVAIFIISGIMLGKNLLASRHENEQFENLRQIIAAPNMDVALLNEPSVDKLLDVVENIIMLPAMEKLYEINSDIIAWLRIEGTNIDYPLTHTPNDTQYYLRRSFSGEYSLSGVPFIGGGALDAGNTIIYGHNMKNGTMFADLLQYESYAFFESHQIIHLDTLYEHRQYQVIGAFWSKIYEPDESGFRYYEHTVFEDESRYDEFMSQVKVEALYKTKVPSTYGDMFITLSTCAYHVPNGRFVVIAKCVDAEVKDET